MQFDVVIVGASPGGMALAKSLGGTGLGVAIVERRPEAALADPAYDGREIALTHGSMAILRGLDAWRHVPPDVPSAMRAARVLNGGSPYVLRFDTQGQRHATLGSLVPNHLLRRALYRAVKDQADIRLFCDAAVADVALGAGAGRSVTLEDGRVLGARLVIVADTRFSALRRQQGITAATQDFRKVMVVCAVEHDEPHGHVATEWFEHGHTIAMLPLQGRRSSAVITVADAEAKRLMALDEPAFGADVTRRFRGRLGTMRLDSARHAYPLVATFARRFTGPRLALVGDAAVGMHPVTAHGFNFGLQGQDTLARLIRRAAGRGGDIAAPAVLREYAVRHRAATLPLWLATNTLALLYVDERLPARLAREVTLRLGGGLPFVRQAIVANLMRGGGSEAARA